MADEKEKQQVNVDFSNFPELLKALDEMVKADDSDRSKFIRNLVRKEQSSRQQMELPLATVPARRSAKGRGRKSQAVAA